MDHPDWLTFALAAMSTFQTVALAFMASRSRRVRQGDHDEGEPGRHERREPPT